MTTLDYKKVAKKNGFDIYKSIAGDLSFYYQITRNGARITKANSMKDVNKFIQLTKILGIGKAEEVWDKKIRSRKVWYNFGYLKGKEAKKYAQYEGAYGDLVKKLKNKKRRK